MANLKPPTMVEILDDDDDDDIAFLSELEAAEAQALSLSSSKRRRVTLPSSSPSPSPLPSPSPIFIGSRVKLEERESEKSNEQEGAYTAALRGSKSLTWQKQTQTQTQIGSSNSYALPQGAPRAATGGSGGGACFKCGMEGHWARECSQTTAVAVAGAVPGVEKGCPCGLGNCLVLTANTERNRGRKFFKCPIRQENGGCGFFEWCDESSGNRTEERAWKNGSQEQLYQRPANQGTSGFTKPWNEYDKGASYMSSGYGAAQKFETTDNKSYGTRTGLSCFKCGEEGHWARDCPTMPSSNAPVAAKGKTSNSNTCFKCGESGHWAKDCSQGQSTNVRNW